MESVRSERAEHIAGLSLDVLTDYDRLREFVHPSAVSCVLHRGEKFRPMPTLCPICAVADCRRRYRNLAGVKTWP